MHSLLRLTRHLRNQHQYYQAMSWNISPRVYRRHNPGENFTAQSLLLHGYGAVKELNESSHFRLVGVFFGLKHFSFALSLMRSPLKLTGSPSWDFQHLFLRRNNWETGEISHSLTLVSQRSHSCLGEMNETLLRSLLQCSFPLGRKGTADIKISKLCRHVKATPLEQKLSPVEIKT